MNLNFGKWFYNLFSTFSIAGNERNLLLQESHTTFLPIDLCNSLWCVSKEVRGVNGGVQSMESFEHIQMAWLSCKMSWGPAHISYQAGPGSVFYEELHPLHMTLEIPRRNRRLIEFKMSPLAKGQRSSREHTRGEDICLWVPSGFLASSPPLFPFLNEGLSAPPSPLWILFSTQGLGPSIPNTPSRTHPLLAHSCRPPLEILFSLTPTCASTDKAFWFWHSQCWFNKIYILSQYEWISRALCYIRQR